MCGRFSLGVDTDRLIADFGLTSIAATHEPRFNIAPTQPVPAVVLAEGGLRLGSLRWGLQPGGRRGPGSGRPLINARSETVARRPAFRELFRTRRCWILADGFYEWRRGPDGSSTPYHFRLPHGPPFAFAGLWDRAWGEDHDIPSCAILTAPANAAVAPVHDRMPVILPAQWRERWLDPEAPPIELHALLRPYPGELQGFVVSPLVNNPRQDAPHLREPLSQKPGTP